MTAEIVAAIVIQPASRLSGENGGHAVALPTLQKIGPALVAMTSEVSVCVLAARMRPSHASCLPSERQRAQGMPGARCTRGLVCICAKKKRTRAYR